MTLNDNNTEQTKEHKEKEKEACKKSLRSLSRTLPQRLGSMSYRDQNEALKKKFNEPVKV